MGSFATFVFCCELAGYNRGYPGGYEMLQLHYGDADHGLLVQLALLLASTAVRLVLFGLVLGIGGAWVARAFFDGNYRVEKMKGGSVSGGSGLSEALLPGAK